MQEKQQAVGTIQVGRSGDLVVLILRENVSDAIETRRGIELLFEVANDCQSAGFSGYFTSQLYGVEPQDMDFLCDPVEDLASRDLLREVVGAFRVIVSTHPDPNAVLKVGLDDIVIACVDRLIRRSALTPHRERASSGCDVHYLIEFVQRPIGLSVYGRRRNFDGGHNADIVYELRKVFKQKTRFPAGT